MVRFFPYAIVSERSSRGAFYKVYPAVTDVNYFLTPTTIKNAVFIPYMVFNFQASKNEALRGHINHDLNKVRAILLALVRKTMRRSVRKISLLLTQNENKAIQLYVYLFMIEYCIL